MDIPRATRLSETSNSTITKLRGSERATGEGDRGSHKLEATKIADEQ
jgi:hypothetical protein